MEIDGRIYEKDAIWPRHMIAAEVDGRETHDTLEAFITDRENDRVFQGNGWLTPRVTSHDLDNHHQLKRQFLAMFALREAQIPLPS